MPGAAERALAVQHRAVVDELKALAEGSRPPYASSSAFRFVFDRSAGRDVADVSAPAQQLGVLLRAVREQPLRPPRRQGDRAPSAAGEPAAEESGAIEAAEPPPAAPAATAAGREKAELGCQALERGWFEEAAALFLEGANFVPTEPFMWFGAGLAASRFDQTVAASYLDKASRYLGPDDPAGAAYVAIVAAAMLEEAGDVRAARRLLRARIEDLDISCPALSLHLARLGPSASSHVADALVLDPMLATDVGVLGLDPDGETEKERRQRSEHELSRLAFSIGELRKVGDGPPRPDPDRSGTGEATSLAEIELQLWRRIEICEREIERARFIVEEREAARRDKENQLVEANERARGDLDNSVALPFFASCVVIAFTVLAVGVAGRLLASLMSSLTWLVTVMTWLTIVSLVTVGILRFQDVVWPRRYYLDARRAKSAIPSLEWDVSNLRNDEFEARRRFDRARQDTELRVRRIIARRSAVIPQRPSFLAERGSAEAGTRQPEPTSP